MKKFNPKEINGNEIIDFLNKETENNDDLCDISIVPGSFVFEEQEVEGNKYKLYFTGSYNNWGTHQDIEGNILTIDKDGVRFSLDEPFEGDGTDEALEEVLEKWLKNHKFSNNSEEEFMSLMREVYEKLPEISFTCKKDMQKVIDKLVKAKTYMK